MKNKIAFLLIAAGLLLSNSLWASVLYDEPVEDIDILENGNNPSLPIIICSNPEVDVNLTDSNLHLSFAKLQEELTVIIKEKETGKIIGKESYSGVADIIFNTILPDGKNYTVQLKMK